MSQPLNTRDFAPWMPAHQRNTLLVSLTGEFYTGNVVLGEPQTTPDINAAFRMTPLEAAHSASTFLQRSGESWVVREVDHRQPLNGPPHRDDFVVDGFDFAATAALKKQIGNVGVCRIVEDGTVVEARVLPRDIKQEK